MRKKNHILPEAILIKFIIMTDGDIQIDISLNGAIVIVVGLATPCFIEGYEVDEIGDQCHWKAY